jgi:hypothetical protein
MSTASADYEGRGVVSANLAVLGVTLQRVQPEHAESVQDGAALKLVARTFVALEADGRGGYIGPDILFPLDYWT